MKWFKLDTTMPDDPRIRAVLARFGNAGLGALVRLWCFVAAHGKRRPGWSLDSAGKPIPEEFLQAATGLTENEFCVLLSELSKNRHISRFQWENRRVVVFPAMASRVDVYTNRRVRREFTQSAKNVPLEEKRREEISTKDKNSGAKRRALPQHVEKSTVPVVRKVIHTLLRQIPKQETADFASLKEHVKQACATYRLAYDSELVGKELESALAIRAKRR